MLAFGLWRTAGRLAESQDLLSCSVKHFGADSLLEVLCRGLTIPQSHEPRMAWLRYSEWVFAACWDTGSVASGAHLQHSAANLLLLSRHQTLRFQHFGNYSSHLQLSVAFEGLPMQ